MGNSNQKIVDAFFEANGKHDIDKIKEVMDDSVVWYFMGRHPFAGIKRGVSEVVAFFDSMAKLMGESKPTVEKPIVSENDNYLIECVHTKTNRQDGINVDHHACVLWTFDQGKIIEGRHFFSDPEALDRYLNAAAKAQK